MDEFEELLVRDEDRKLLARKLLRRACRSKSYKVLPILLDDGACDKNDIFDDKTMLDEVLELVKHDCTFDVVVALLKEYGAQTAQQIADKNAELAEEREYMPFSWQ